jgi:hypothetical protein
MAENCIHRPNGHQIVPFDAPTCVEYKNHQTFTFRIEVRMTGDMRIPIGGCLVRCFTMLHGVGCRTFPQRNNFPFLRLSREFYRLDDLIDGLRSGCGAFCRDEVFGCVHVLRFVLKERDCSLHRPERAGPLLTKRTRLCPRRRAAEHQQLSDGGRKDVATAGARLRGATRGAGAAGMNTTENRIGRCRPIENVNGG